MAKCYIVGAGDCVRLDFKKENEDFVIAADGGYRYLCDSQITPDAVIGDFDSLGFLPESDNVIKLNPVKDVTDMKAAADYGIEKGYAEFHFYGACGGRFDHTLANVQLVASLAKESFKAYIHDGDTVITAICNGEIEFDSSHNGYISVFSYSDEAVGVDIEGLKYGVCNGKLKNSFPLGVSNEFIGKKSRVSVADGVLIVVYFNTTS